MKLRVSVIAGLLLFVIYSAPATSQESDLLGIFFDEAGTQTSISTAEPNQIVTFYLILLNPTHAEGVHSWECIIEARSGIDTAPMFGWEFSSPGINLYEPPSFHVLLLSPLPPTGPVVLMSAGVLVNDLAEVLFYLHPLDPPSLENPPGGGYPVTTPLYGYGDDNYQSLGWTSGCEAEPVARINDDSMDPYWGLDVLPAEIVFDPLPAGETAWENFNLYNVGEVTVSGQIDISGLGFNYNHSEEAWTDDQQWFRIVPQEGLLVNLGVVSAMDEEYTGSLDISVCGETTAITLVKLAYYECAITPPSGDFGTVIAGVPVQQTFEVRNTGEQLLEGQVSIPATCSEFTLVDGEEFFSLPQDEIHNFTVEFNPSVGGFYECNAFVSTECADVELVGFCDVVTGDCWDYQNADGPIVGSVDTPGFANEVAVAGNYAYVADGSGLQVIDISVPGLSEIESSVDEIASHAVAVAGNYAYVVGGGGLQVIDISVLESPEIVGVGTGFYGSAIAVAGNNAYVVAGCGGPSSCLQVIDISVPESPVIVGAVYPGAFMRINNVAVAGNYAYMVVSCIYYDPPPGVPPPPCWGFQVVDISVPESPWIIGTLPGSRGNGIAVAGNYAYVQEADSWDPVMQVIDVSVPASPEIVGSVDTPGSAWDIAIARNYAYVAGVGGLHVIDITVPESPAIVGAVNTPYEVLSVAVAGNCAYVPSGYSGLQIALRQCDTSDSDLFVLDEDILFDTDLGPIYPYIGLEMTIGVTVKNSSEVDANGHVIFEYEDNGGEGQLIGQADVFVPASGPPPGEQWVEVPWTVQDVNTVIHVTVTEVSPPDGDESNNHAQKALTEETIPVFLSSFQALSEATGVLLEWSVSGEPNGFLIERQQEDQDTWRLLTAEPVRDATGLEPGEYVLRDTDVVSGQTYWYRLTAMMPDANEVTLGTTSVQYLTELPDKLGLGDVFPNPFNPQTNITFTVDRPAQVRIAIYNLSGRRIAVVADGVYPVGIHVVEWDGRDTNNQIISSGPYIVRLETDSRVEARMVMLVR